MLAKTTRMARLFDFYGSLLTQKQQEMFDLYYQHDLSLGEIAENLHVSRQAVHDNLRRTERLLEAYEKKLRLVERFRQAQEQLQLVERLFAEAEPDKKAQGKRIVDTLKGLLIP